MLPCIYACNLGGEEMEYVNHYKYLGVNISNTAKFSVAEKKT